MLVVSVSRHTIENNLLQKRNDPPFEIRRSTDDPNPERVHSAEFHGTVRLMYDPNDPLISKAYCWIEIDEVRAEHVHALLNAVHGQQAHIEAAAHCAVETDAVVVRKEINLAVCEAAAISDGV